MNISHVSGAPAQQMQASPVTVSPGAAPGRIVVVVPMVVEPALAAARIQQVSAARKAGVLLIGVTSPAISHHVLWTNLLQTAGFLQHAGIQAQLQVERNLDSLPAALSGLSDDDLLACCVDDTQPSGRGRLIELLANRFRRPVYAFMLSAYPAPSSPGVAAALAPWLGSAVILAGFLWLQVRLAQYGDDPVTTLLLLASVLIEVGAVTLFNALLP